VLIERKTTVDLAACVYGRISGGEREFLEGAVGLYSDNEYFEMEVDSLTPQLWNWPAGSTAAGDYAWVNTRQIWAAGTVNFSTGKIHIDAYTQ
jgi:hypothetical protein